jgi:hypothetical protein
LIVGTNFLGNVDNVRFYDTITIIDVFHTLIGYEPRETAGNGGLFMTVPNTRWMCNEGSGLTITDDKRGLVGTANSLDHVQRYDDTFPHYDVTPLMQHYRRGK